MLKANFTCSATRSDDKLATTMQVVAALQNLTGMYAS